MQLAESDTIVAISTPPGRGGIGIVRLSGPQAQAIAEPLLRLRHPLAAGQVRFAEVVDQGMGAETGQTLDEAVVTFFAAPHSYTSEDVVEIACHGAPVLLDDLLRRGIAAGARLAEPGEFTRRAFLGGRIDLTQAEAVDDLIQAHTLHQARIAAQQLGGSLSRRVVPVKQSLIALIGALEAGIDFAEDDIDLLPKADMLAQIEAVRAPLAALASTFAYGRIVRHGLTLAIVGRPNAGKSSLFNRLVERERAIVTASPGTTRDLVTEQVALAGIPIQLVDTAGMRTAGCIPLDEAEAIGIERSREAMAEADVVLLVLDVTLAPDAEDAALEASLSGRPFLLVRNKCDLLAPGTPSSAGIAVSALTGEGLPALREAILSLVNAGSHTESALLTSLRQQQAVTEAIAALARATEIATHDGPHEVLLVDLYAALEALDALTGATTKDDILHLIFSRFCIGK